MALPLLFEIGVEELPSSFVDGALAALPEIVRSRLAGARLAHGPIEFFGTPRRLSFLVHDLAEQQTDLDLDVVGPPEAAAFKDGAPTRAAEAFAQKVGVPVSDLRVQDFQADGKQKAGRFVVGRKQEKGEPASTLLGALLASVVPAIPFRKSMRWGVGDLAFGRPIQWLVALLGDDVIAVEVAGQTSGRVSRGHRFLAPAPVSIANAATYSDTMRKVHVVANRAERETVMMARVAEAAKAHNAAYDTEQLLIDENASLVEEPLVVLGSYDPKFLELPAAVIRAAARGHQRYFCLEQADGALLPMYLAVVNTANDPAVIAKGMNRVMTARLADARFFYEEDKKNRLEVFTTKLAGVVFHHRLGTVKDKVARLVELTAAFAASLGASPETKTHAERTAALCKFDLVSLMVSEFPELQGEMGAAYARFAGEPEAVATAIAGHYRPLGASDPVADTDAAALVALADRCDTLVGCFAVGLVPSGTADPFALRRNCIAILRTLIESATRNPAYGDLDVATMLALAYQAHARQTAAAHAAGAKRTLDLDETDTVAKVLEFTGERLRGLLTTATSSAVADAVLSSLPAKGSKIACFPIAALARARAIQQVVQGGANWLEKARTVAKRLSGIAQGTTAELHSALNPEKPDDAVICTTVTQLAEQTANLTTEAATLAALGSAEALAQTLDDIFARTLVNDPNDPFTGKRLAVLSYGARCMLQIADFTRLH